MRSTMLILPVLVQMVLLSGPGAEAFAAGSYEREVVLDGHLVWKSGELMRFVELARGSLPNRDGEFLRLNTGDSSFILRDGVALEDITRVGASHGSGHYVLTGPSSEIVLIWLEHRVILTVQAEDRDQMEMVSAALEQKIRAALEQSPREQPTVPAPPRSHLRDFELGPLAFTYDDVLRLVEQIESHLPPAKLGETALTIRSGDKEVKIPGPLTENALTRLPQGATSLRYEYRAPNMSISRVAISLKDVSRRVEVEGTNEGQV